MEFSLQFYKNQRVVMHCPTADSARIFLDFLHDAGRMWITKTPYSDDTRWDMFCEKTCYDFNAGQFYKIGWYRDHHYQVLEFSDFDFSSPVLPAPQPLDDFFGGG